LYVDARLIHGDLSEYNILVVPACQVDNNISSIEDSSNELQAVLIDFGQAVDVRHPEANSLLHRDLSRVRTFFVNQDVQTLDVSEAMEFVVDDFDNTLGKASDEYDAEFPDFHEVAEDEIPKSATVDEELSYIE
jgi:serine/threonine-protein kinase RIO1